MISSLHPRFPLFGLLLCLTLTLWSGITLGQSVPSYVPTNGLVGWWGFNGNAQDGSGNGNHGTVNGATLTTDRFGNQNSAYSYDGINDYIQTSFSGPQGNSPRTISIWFKTSQLHTSNPIPGYMNEQMCLVSYGNSSYAGGTFDCSINHNCQGVTLDVAGGLFTRPSVTNNNLWHNLIFVYDGLNYQNVFTYYDGIMQQTSLFCAGTSHPINTGNSYPITF
ncbi:MAG: Internalin-J precursor, partial [Bacteroidota bacterium]